MGDFNKLVGKFLIAALLISSFFIFIVTTQSDNDSIDPLRNQESFNRSLESLLENIDESTTSAEEKYGVFNSEEPQRGLGGINLYSVVSVGKTFSSIVFGFFGTIINLPLIVLGIPSTVYSLLITWLIIFVIAALWVFYKYG
jgi:hypothetical protein